VAKRTMTQRSFVLGETRADLLEADDTQMRQQSVKRGENVRVTAARGLMARDGTFWRNDAAGARDLIEIRPKSGLIYGLIITDTALTIIDRLANVEFSMAPVPWASAENVWVEPFREETIIGGEFGIYTLTYATSGWSFAPFAFDTVSGGEIAQPYWAFEKNLTMAPSARSGAVNVVMSGAFWTPDYVGLHVRYGGREISITGYVSPTVATGTVVSILPPCFDVVVANGALFKAGDAVIGQDTDFNGLVISVSGNVLKVVTVTFFDGPDAGEKLSSPLGSSDVVSKVEIAPLPSPIWDEPLMSPVRGYPRAGASAAGRLALVDFPQVPSAICLSSVRSVKDFLVGAEDDDAISRTVGDNAPRFLHAVNAGDLLLFSDRGLYYVGLRDGGLLTPATFNAILVDKAACSTVRPVAINDGVIFVEASETAVSAALLDGNIYLKWSVRQISTFHNHQIKKPVKLCGPSLYAETPEKYVFVVNEDGTLAAMSWIDKFDPESIGFVPWFTQGRFVSISPIFGGYWTIVDRDIGEATSRFLEEFSSDAALDCTVNIAALEPLLVNGLPLTVNGLPLEISRSNAIPIAGATVAVWDKGFDYGDHLILEDGSIEADIASDAVAGFNFVSTVGVWPIEVIESERAGMLKARVIAGSVSVMSSQKITIRCNSSERSVGGYAFGDPLTEPPPERTRLHRFSILGRRDHPTIEIIKDRPGAFHILAVTQEVQF
jgi:hypothetical protein